MGKESACKAGAAVRSLGLEDLLEKEVATCSNILLAWRIPRMEEPGGLQSMGSQRVGQDLVTEHSSLLVLLVVWSHKGGLLGLL